MEEFKLIERIENKIFGICYGETHEKFLNILAIVFKKIGEGDTDILIDGEIPFLFYQLIAPLNKA